MNAMLSATKDISIVQAKSGKPSIRVTCEDNSIKTLHSLYDPEAEAKSTVGAFTFNGKGILVVLGLGLGYHVAELSRRYPEAKIIIVESNAAIYENAMAYGPELDKVHEILTGLSYDQAIHKLTEIQLKTGFIPITVFPLSSSVAAFPSYYAPLLTSLKNTESIKLWDKLRYRKFNTDSLSILMIDSGYFLLTEAEKALRSYGHRVIRVHVNKKDRGDRIISGIMETILGCKPDFLLTVNHLGLDEEGILTDFLTSIEMPVASWYVDSPNLIVKAFNKNVSPFIALFMWDRSYINDMKSMGFEIVEYLPLATDEKLFRPLIAGKHRKKLSKFICDISFVGNSMVEPVYKWMDRVNDDMKPIALRLSENFNRSVNINEMLMDDEMEQYSRLTEKGKMDFEAAVIWKATFIYRLECINKIESQGLKIFGDKHWKNLLDSNAAIYPPVNYYKELPYLFNACKINFNATSMQMKEGVNQRVFDVPACGSFLLTDDQSSLYELFERGREVITYKNKEEISGLVTYYLKNQSAMERIAENARNRVLSQHTYRHRLEKMIECMKGNYS
ncbi:MAG: glycosyltransferase [Nitrospiraceae bacterium]|nr:MAG: glycosyltransferase [Nitrospiraceae bacterium]